MPSSTRWAPGSVQCGASVTSGVSQGAWDLGPPHRGAKTAALAGPGGNAGGAVGPDRPGRRDLLASRGGRHVGTGVRRTRYRVWKDVPDPVIQDPGDAIVRVDAVTICGTDLHILKGDVPDVDRGPRPRPRGRRHRDRDRRAACAAWPRATGCWSPASPPAAAAATAARAATGSARRRRLDPGPPHRRHPGRAGPGPLRRPLAARAPGPGQRRGGAAARRHPAHLLRGRRPRRHGAARGHRGHRRRRPDRPGRGAHRPALQPHPHHRRRPGRGAARRREADRRRPRRQPGRRRARRGRRT